MSSRDPRVFFGLDASRLAATVEIEWPSGARRPLKAVAANRIVTVWEPEGRECAPRTN